MIDFHGQIIGLALSRDGESLYANVRAWPEKAVPTTEAPAPSIANRIETHVVDMRTLEKTGQVRLYKGDVLHACVSSYLLEGQFHLSRPVFFLASIL